MQYLVNIDISVTKLFHLFSSRQWHGTLLIYLGFVETIFGWEWRIRIYKSWKQRCEDSVLSWQSPTMERHSSPVAPCLSHWLMWKLSTRFVFIIFLHSQMAAIRFILLPAAGCTNICLIRGNRILSDKQDTFKFPLGNKWKIRRTMFDFSDKLCQYVCLLHHMDESIEEVTRKMACYS